MRKLIFFITVVSFVGCRNTPINSTGITRKSDNDVLKVALLGKWGSLGESEPVWKFLTDSLYYYEEKKKYAYNLAGDSLTVFYKEGPFALKNVHIVADTLYFKDEHGIVKAYRFK